MPNSIQEVQKTFDDSSTDTLRAVCIMAQRSIRDRIAKMGVVHTRQRGYLERAAELLTEAARELAKAGE